MQSIHSEESMQPQTRLVQIFAVTFAVVILLLGLSIQSAFATSSPNSFAPATTPVPGEESCEDSGGSWDGPGFQDGTCTYEDGSKTATAECGPFGSYKEDFAGGNVIDTRCVYNHGFGGSGGSSSNNPSGQVTLKLRQGKNGYVIFNFGVCQEQQCTITAHLPNDPKSELPTPNFGTLFVRFASDPGGYLVCFKNSSGGETRSLYKFVNGSWLALATSSATPICAASSGNGSYYLGK
jgi:hypothetical protein